MNYKKQIDIIEDYFRAGEKIKEDYKLGVEFEHFIVDKDSLRTINYYDNKGTVDTLEKLIERGWIGDYEEGYLLGVHKDDKVITLEPGSQFEFSIEAKKTIKELEVEYKSFLKEIEIILGEKNQLLLPVGYHPVTKIDEIKLLPKKRYDYMFEYFKDKGRYAHNMMKGTAALQVSIDYSSQEDYARKFRLANGITPIILALTSNASFFEGETFTRSNLRALIWSNMDDQRSGVVTNGLDEDFSYKKYGQYLLEVEPIFTMRDGEAIFTGNKKIKEVFNPEDFTVKELEHLMTMVFPDVRTKGFIEIRMMDSIPYPLNFSMISLIKGLFYSDEGLEQLDGLLEGLRIGEVNKAKLEIIDQGLKTDYLGKDILWWGEKLVEIAKEGLKEDEVHYIYPLEEMLKSLRHNS